MNEYSISDYCIFSYAIPTTSDCGNKVTTAKDCVVNFKTVLSSESFFYGTFTRKCV